MKDSVQEGWDGFALHSNFATPYFHAGKYNICNITGHSFIPR